MDFNDYFFQFNLSYDKGALLDLYDQYIHEFPAEKSINSPFKSVSDNIDLGDNPEVAKIMDCLPIIPRKPFSYELTSIVKSVKTHTNPRNNGTIFFPVYGEVKVNFYHWPAKPDENGRPLLSPWPDQRSKLTEDEEKALNDSLFHSVILDKPLAINGLKVHSYEPTSLEPPIVLAVKIPLEVDWDDLINNHIRYE